MTDVVLPGVPFPLEASGHPACQAVVSDGALILTSGSKSDLFIDPAGEEGARPDAGRLTGLPGDRDFTLVARVTVRFGNVFDAGVLLLYQLVRDRGRRALAADHPVRPGMGVPRLRRWRLVEAAALLHARRGVRRPGRIPRPVAQRPGLYRGVRERRLHARRARRPPRRQLAGQGREVARPPVP